MEKERFYYSLPYTVRKVDCIFDETLKICGILPYSKYSRSLPRVTICGIWDTDKNTLSFGVSRCSDKDSFIKEIGRSISYKRAKAMPYKVVSVDKTNVSETFIKESQIIEFEILKMKYPIQLD